MEHVTLKKKLSTYVSESGRLRNVSEELLCELLTAWEQWTGSAKEFYASIGFSHRQMAKLLGKAKKLKREGLFGQSDFKEIVVEPTVLPIPAAHCGQFIEVNWKGAHIIRFPSVDPLIEFLDKTG